MAQTQGHKPIPRITDERHAGVADQRNLRALLHRDDKFGRPRQLVVFMVADERLPNVVVAEKLLRVPRVFAGNLVDFFQDAERTQGNVLKVADGRGNEVKAYLTAA